MSERDPVVVLLKRLERPVVPRREFADALRERLVAELAQVNGDPARLPRLTPPRRRRHMLAAAAGLAVLGAVVAAVLLSRPSPASALDVIHHAEHQAASLPPFEATVRFDISPGGPTETMAVSYDGPSRLRTVITGQHPPGLGARAVGSYDVLNGASFGSFDAERKIFNVFPAPPRFAPLSFLAWRGGLPDWERICRGRGAKVLPDTQIVGRDARHVRCTDVAGRVWELWIDRQTGLLLKLVGQVGGGGDFFLDSAPQTSQQGGFTIEQLRYRPSFPSKTFKLAGPPGAMDLHARRQAAIAKLPPFRAIFAVTGGGTSYVDEAWWQNDSRWRRAILSDSPRDARDAARGGAGSFFVRINGSTYSYNARDKTFARGLVNPDPLTELLPENDPRYSTTACPIVGRHQIAGRPAVHRHCVGYDIWIDSPTGITLQTTSPGFRLRVRRIDYDPVFPSGTFRFERPAGSRSARQRANDPYYKTTLSPGKPAPNWHARWLNGGSFQITDLRGKPALLLIFSDTCPAGDPTCDVFAPLEHVYKHAKRQLTIIWVDFQGDVATARNIIRHNHLTFPVVNDTEGFGNSFKTWKFQGYPYWVLLDSHGRVIEARLKPQTITELRQLIAASR